MKTTIVTGCDANYYPLLQELIASIRQFPESNAVDICVIDAGLSREQVEALSGSAARVVSPEWPAAIPAERTKGRCGRRTGTSPHRSVADGQRVAGIYRRSIILASGRYAMLDDGVGFRLVPWRPVIEQRLGQQIAATVRGGGVSWEIGRTKGISV